MIDFSALIYMAVLFIPIQILAILAVKWFHKTKFGRNIVSRLLIGLGTLGFGLVVLAMWYQFTVDFGWYTLSDFTALSDPTKTVEGVISDPLNYYISVYIALLPLIALVMLVTGYVFNKDRWMDLVNVKNIRFWLFPLPQLYSLISSKIPSSK